MRKLGAFGLAAAFLAAAVLVARVRGRGRPEPAGHRGRPARQDPVRGAPVEHVDARPRRPVPDPAAPGGARRARRRAARPGRGRRTRASSATRWSIRGCSGASAGAGLGATLAIVDLGGAGPGVVPVAAFVGVAGRGRRRLPDRHRGQPPDRARGRRRDAAAGRDRGRQLPHRRADVPAAALGPGHPGRLQLAARLAGGRELAAGDHDPAVRRGQLGRHPAARPAPGRARGGRRGGPRARPAPGA